MIGILDYGIGNVASFLRAFRSIDQEAVLISTAEDVDKVSHLLLPGVGSFDTAMTRFTQSGLRHRVEEKVLVEEAPILGVCVGFQMMSAGSAEGTTDGLGWLRGGYTVSVSDTWSDEVDFPLPHLGWNQVQVKSAASRIFQGLSGAEFYFLHSFALEQSPLLPTSATAWYGNDIVAACEQGNIMGVQFHPEKSHSSGLELLRNFASLA